jgi:hypothetical protein
MRFILRLAAVAGRLPRWARPAWYVGVYVGLIVALRAAGALIGSVLAGRGIPTSVLLQVPIAILVGAYMGAVGGICYALVHPPLHRALKRIGDVVTGLVCVYAYMLAFGLPAAAFSHDPELTSMVRDPIFWGVASFFGLLVGAMLAYSHRGA